MELSFPLSVATAILYDPGVAGIISFLGSIDSREWRREIPLLRALFNRAQIALATIVVGEIFHAWASTRSSFALLVLVALIAGAAGYAVNVALVTTAMTLDYAVPAADVLQQLRVGGLTQFLVTYFGLGLFGPILARFFTEVGPWSLLIVLGPLLLTRQMLFRSLALEAAEARYKELVERVPTVSYIRAADQTASTIYVSPQIETILGYAPNQWLLDPLLWSKILHPLDRDRVLAAHEHASAGGARFLQEYRVMSSDGHRVWVRDEATLVRAEGDRPPCWHGVILDITGGRQAPDQISFLAYHDNLTELPNRAMFKEILGLALGRARRTESAVAVLYTDLDNFKLVNDSLGHRAGDELLCHVAARLRSVAREADLVARHGGDEFLVIMADLNLHTAHGAAAQVAGRIHAALRQPFLLDSMEVYVSVSIGMSLFPFDAADEVDLMRNADRAMYRSKKAGPGGSMSLGGENWDPLTELSLATRLRRAIEEQQWVLHYQPIADLEDGTVRGVEALVRWHDPDLGLIYPSRFLPLAEKMGLIARIDDWVLGEVARQMRAWRKEGITLEASFNFSLRRLWEQDVVECVIGTLRSNGVPPSSVVIEITESTAMADPERTQRVLADLHSHGLRVAIDDFGTAYSSLSRLKELDVDVLKIDASFVKDALRSSKSASMLTAIVRLAHAVGIEPLGEGIESPEQARYLLELGCKRGQGYYFSPPVGPERIPALLGSPTGSRRLVHLSQENIDRSLGEIRQAPAR